VGNPTLSIVVPWNGADDLAVALAALTVIDRQQIEAYGLPLLYASGVRYKTVHGPDRCRSDMPESCERFLSARQLLLERFGDCKDLSCYLAAERNLHGDTHARAFAVRTKIGWHVKVRHGDGSIEDPSVRLGMGKVR
jgi:hypothetical protein